MLNLTRLNHIIRIDEMYKKILKDFCTKLNIYYEGRGN